jgi:Inner membrane component of T3SS, cytoplasmic domain
VVTGLVLYGTGRVHELSPARDHFTLGSAPDQDIAIHSPFVSARHCRLERKLLGLRVTDQGSKNGTYYEGEREKTGFYLRPGKTFVVGALPHCFLALDDEMRACYPVLIDILGAPEAYALRGETPSPSDMIRAAVHGIHLLITSEPDCGQDRLARIVHSISRCRSRQIVELDQVPVDRAHQLELIRRRAARSTLVLDLGDNDTRLPSNFITTVFSSRFQVRVIALARSLEVADEALGERARQMQHIWVPPIVNRPEAVDRLLDRMFVERGSPLRVAGMTPDNQRALRGHGWPGNFASLRQAADRLAATARLGSVNQAAHELGVAPATLYHWYSKTMRLSHPLVPASA